jgi:hypothetical protein
LKTCPFLFWWDAVKKAYLTPCPLSKRGIERDFNSLFGEGGLMKLPLSLTLSHKGRGNWRVKAGVLEGRSPSFFFFSLLFREGGQGDGLFK